MAGSGHSGVKASSGAVSQRLIASFREVSGSTAERVRSALARAVEERWLEPGTRLAEEQLADTFDVSRTPVREALFRLESDQLVERDRNGGLFVGRISVQQIIDLYAVREALDGASARLAASFAPRLELRKLRLVNEAMAAAAEQLRLEEMADLNIEFHDLVAAASNNAMLVKFISQIHRYVRRFQTTTFSYPDRAMQAVREHELLIDAIATTDPERAENIAREHMRAALEVRIHLEAESGLPT